MQDIAISFQHVQKVYKDFIALKDITFEVKKGRFLALLGPNGAGKTTLISCLAGLAKRSGGRILVFGEDPERNPTYTKMTLGVVEQELTFDPFFTVEEVLKIRRGLFGLPPDKDYLHWLLKKLDLWEKRHTRTRFLSGGMKRRLMIAKALVHHPKILILDEPTAGVDIALRKRLYDFLGELRKKFHLTILLTTHYLEEAELLAEDIAIIHKGRILVSDTKENILKRKKRILEVTTEDGSKKNFPISETFSLEKVLCTLPKIKDIRIKEPKLEDIFLEITEKASNSL